MTTQLIENQSQEEASIGAVMTVTAADRVLQHRQMLDIAEPKAGQTEFGGVAARANHGGTTIRGSREEIQRCPPEGLLSTFGFRCTVSESAFNKE